MGLPFFIVAVQESFSYQAIVHLFYYFPLEILPFSLFFAFLFQIYQPSQCLSLKTRYISVEK